MGSFRIEKKKKKFTENFETKPNKVILKQFYNHRF